MAQKLPLKNIPSIQTKNPNKFALIIGNEDYTSRQTGLTSESNVAFAVNDAKIFKEYCVNTFGVLEENIQFLTNATTYRICCTPCCLKIETSS